MEDLFTKRDYVRTNNFSINARISKDGKVWHEVNVPNIAAGGLLIHTNQDFCCGEEVWFDMKIDPRLARIVPISVKTKGIVRVERGEYADQHQYAITFTEISSGDQIRLDELVHMAAHKYGDK